MKNLILIISLLALPGCGQERVIGHTDGRNITIDYAWIEAHGLDPALIKLHEECHNIGLEHCRRSSCLMYWVYQVDIIFGPAKKKLCRECFIKVQPTTLGWVSRKIK
jgi:hypothetical protein